MNRRVSAICVAVILPAISIVGCGGKPSAQPLDPQAFYAPPAPGQAHAVPQATIPGPAVIADNPDSINTDPVVTAAETRPAPTVNPVTSPGVSKGEFVTMGGVLTIVDNSPIYAHKVLALCEGELSVKAKSLNEPEFRRLVTELVQKSTGLLARDELMFANASRILDAEEKRMVEGYVGMWRNQQIAEAGGSVENARRRALATGVDFDTQLDQKFRESTTRIFYARHVMPKIQISADDMRQYYALNKAKLFTQLSAARFRCIRVSEASTGSADAAIKKIKRIRDDAISGVDFAKLAGDFNDDPAWQKNSGDMGWIQKGAFRLEKIEEAVWKLQPGEVSDIIQIDRNYYIAKLEERKLGREAAFEEDEVQARCERDLRGQRFIAEQEKITAKLMAEAVMHPYPPDYSLAIEMAMQKYPVWRAR